MLITTGKQSAQIDSFTQDKIGIPGLVLMESAARCVAESAGGTAPFFSSLVSDREKKKYRITAFAGMGNNGGDAVAAARILHMRGYNAAAVLVGNPDKATDSMKKQLQIAENTGLPLIYTKDGWDRETLKKDTAVVLDGLFGVGLSRPLEGEYAGIVDYINSLDAYKIAIDIPSGIDSATGSVMGCAVRCDKTVTFGTLKVGLVMGDGRDYSGKVEVCDIGLTVPPDGVEGAEVFYGVDSSFLEKLPERRTASHKGSNGRVLIIAGNDDIYGAAYLSARAAYTAGAGLVKVYTTRENKRLMASLLPELLFDTEDQDMLMQDIEWADVIAAGPGLGTDERAVGIVKALADYRKNGRSKTLILDADAINICSSEAGMLSRLSEAFDNRVVITPHMLEMARLAGCSVNDLKKNRFEFLHNTVDKYDIIATLKDSRTCTAMSGDRKVYINLTGNQGLAKGGSGDVLTGIMAAVIAQSGYKTRQELMDQAALSVMIHGLSADMVREKKGTYGMMATDVIENLVNIIR